MTAPLDWVQSYEALQNGVYGLPTDPESGPGRVLAGLTKDNPDYQRLYGTAIRDPNTVTTPATWSQAQAPSWVDWTQLPKMGPAGYQTPNNAMWQAVGGRSGIAPTPGQPTYNDPNYGTLQLVQQRAPNDTSMNILRGLAIAAFAYPTAGALGNYFGLGKLGTGALNAGIKSAPTLAQVHWSEILGGSPTQAAAKTVQAQPTPGLPAEYNPALYGNMGSLAAVPDGSAPVMSGLVPNAYDNSTPNRVVT